MESQTLRQVDSDNTNKTSCVTLIEITHWKMSAFVCDSSQLVNKNRTSEPTMKLFVYFVSTEISFKQ